MQLEETIDGTETADPPDALQLTFRDPSLPVGKTALGQDGQFKE
jgi:hypothetical protein